MESMVYAEDGNMIFVSELPSSDPRYYNPNKTEESEKSVDFGLPIFNLPIREVLVGLGQFGIQVPNMDKLPGFFLNMSISEMTDFCKSVSFVDLQKMIPPVIIDKFKSKLNNMNSDEVTQQIKDLIQKVS